MGGLSEEVNDPASGLPFVVLDRAYGSGLSLLATMLLVTSMLTSMLAFHGTVARYVYGMAREKVLPGWLDLVGGTGARAGAPIAGSLTQSAVALIVLAVVAAVHADPVTFLFTWLSAGAALGVLVLLVLASVAAVVFFRAGRGGHESVWVRTVAPVLGVLAGGAVIVVMLANQSLLLHETKVGPQLVLPGLIVVAVVAGLVWAAQMRRSRPRVYAEIGHGRPDPIAQPGGPVGGAGCLALGTPPCTRCSAWPRPVSRGTRGRPAGSGIVRRTGSVAVLAGRQRLRAGGPGG
ncbi:hypothetical protein [Dactylosporangium darangshiense]|uniref:hypothetical protein n=1 Tax=Dactylosporangium darangshiense TaxID=579108 RepID=UPI0036377D0B